MSSFITISRDGKIVHVDDGMTNFLGFTPQELLNLHLSETLFPPPYGAEIEALQSAFTQGASFLWRNRSTHLRHKDGRTIPSLVSLSLMGELLLLNITQWQDATCMITFHSTGSIISSSCADIVFQWSDSELPRKSLKTIVPSLQLPNETDSPRARRHFRDAMKQTKGYFWGIRKDGGTVPLVVNLDVINVGAFAIFRGKFRRLDLEPEALLIIDRNQILLSSNSQFLEGNFLPLCHMEGKSVESLVGSLPLPSESDSLMIKSSHGTFHCEENTLPALYTVVPLRVSPPNSQFALRIQISRPIFPTSTSTSQLGESTCAPQQGPLLIQNAPTPPTSPLVARRHLTRSPSSPRKGTRSPLPKRIRKETIVSDSSRVGKYIITSRSLGTGSYGRVFSGIDSETGSKVAIKLLKKAELEESELLRAQREIEILQQLKHPNIVSALEVMDTPDSLMIVMERLDGGDLRQFCTERNGLNKTPQYLQEVQDIFRQIVKAIHYCHSRNIIHRDIKHSNILRTSEGVVKLIDFGLSNFSTQDQYLTTFCGSPAYAAPEMLLATKYYGPEVDIWSLGVVLFSLITGKLPFANVNDILTISYSEELLPPECRSLLRVMLAESESRSTITQIMAHPWVGLTSDTSLSSPS